MSFLQIRSTVISPRLPSLAELLFNRLMRGILLRFNRQPIMYDNDESNLSVLIERQAYSNEDKDTGKNITLPPIGTTVTVHWEDGGPWTHGTIVGHGSSDHHERSYKMRVT